MENVVGKEILELRKQAYSCSEATLVGVSRIYGCNIATENVLRACAVGLRGGIGKTMDEGSCGALTGAVMAIGLAKSDNPAMAATLSGELYRSFKKQFGTVSCGRITDANGKKLCNECCIFAARESIRLLNEHKNQ